MDRDQLMLFACFKLLVDYVEKEKPFDHFDYDWSEESRKRGDEIKALYDWWKTERAAEHKAVEKLEDRFERVERRWALEEKDDQMLRRLIEIRRHLWT